MRVGWKSLLLGIGISLTLAGSVMADGMVVPPRFRQVEETGQRAVIWWDGKKETLIVSTTFKGDVSDFAWVIPVPKRPEVTTTKDELFTALKEYTAPKVADNYPKPLGIGYIGGLAPGSMDTAVQVIETKKIDVYDIAILAAQDTWTLQQWLQQHNYEYPKNKEHLFKSYVDRGWYFVAVRVADDSQSYAGTYLKEGHATPLKISFLSEQIVYPLKISGPAAVSSPTPTPFIYSYSYPTSIPARKLAAYSFENGNENWYSGLVEKVDGWDGTHVLSVSQNSSQPQNNYAYISQSGFIAGKTYTLTGFVLPVGKVTGWVKLRVSGGGLEVSSKSEDLEKLNGWMGLNMTFVAKSSTQQISLVSENMSTGKVYWDAIQIVEGSKIEAFENEVLTPQPSVGDCRVYDGNVVGCDSTSSCAYYYCSNQCWPRGTENNVACPTNYYVAPTWAPVEQTQNILIYVFSDHKQTVPGWTTEYAGQISEKNIEKLAIEDSGLAWMDAKKKMYLTKLTRSMNQSQMVDDLVMRNADNDTPVGGGSAGWIWGIPGRTVLILAGPLLAELGIIVYIWNKRRKKK